jgi:hypothetical protein
LLETHQQLNINPPNWGFADEEFDEIEC